MHTTQWVYQSATQTQHSGCISQLHTHTHTTQWVYQSATHAYNSVGVSVSYTHTHTTQWVYQSATHIQHSGCISQLHMHTTQWVYQSATHAHNTVGVLIDDHLYSTILRSLEQTHCACLWFYMSDKLFIARFFEYLPKWCTYSAGMAGAT